MSGDSKREKMQSELFKSNCKLFVAWLSNVAANGKNRMAIASLPSNDPLKDFFYQLCARRAQALAAARTTKSLPVGVAQAAFMAAVGNAFGRTSTAGPNNPTTFINVEAQSVAYTALYFWLIPAVFLASIIGASETKDHVPRILDDIYTDLRRFLQEHEHVARIVESFRENDPMSWIGAPRLHEWLHRKEYEDSEQRKFFGGIYSWQAKPPLGFWFKLSGSNFTLDGQLFQSSLSLAVRFAERSSLALFPQLVFNCRHVGECCNITATQMTRILTWTVRQCNLLL